MSAKLNLEPAAADPLLQSFLQRIEAYQGIGSTNTLGIIEEDEKPSQKGA